MFADQLTGLQRQRRRNPTHLDLDGYSVDLLQHRHPDVQDTADHLTDMGQPTPPYFHHNPGRNVSNRIDSGTTSVAEEDVQTHICQELVAAKNPAATISKSSPPHEILEYQNQMATTSILGEILGQRKSHRLVKVVIAEPSTNGSGNPLYSGMKRTRDIELARLNRLDQEYLFANGAFDFPPQTVG